MKYGIKDETIEKIKILFANYYQIETVILYGSRAKGNYKNGSDIDLTIKGNIDLSVINRISEDIETLLLPYTFDISIYDQISNPELLDHIKRVGIIFYKIEEKKYCD
jgi:uncharacterized protein